MEPTYRIAQLRPLHRRVFRAVQMTISLWVAWDYCNLKKAWANSWAVWGTWTVAAVSGAEEKDHA